MRVLLDRVVTVHYGQCYLANADSPADGDLAANFRGQVNGLCGAARPELLFLITSRHTGEVGLAIELHEREPPLAPEWEDVVAVSATLTGAEPVLSEWGERWYPLDLPPGEYRVRYCARGMDAATDAVTDDGVLDHYLLQLWPAPAAPDEVIREHSRSAAYWHNFARELPPPPTAAELAAEERRRSRRRQLADLARQREEDQRRWGGPPPSEALRRLKGNARKLIRDHRDLAEALAAASPATQRHLAATLARQACTAADLAAVEWIAPALDALDRGDPLPPPFDHHKTAYQRLLADPAISAAVTSAAPGPRLAGGIGGVGRGRASPVPHQQTAAFPAILLAALPDPLQAVLETLSATLSALGPAHRDALFTQVREALS